MPHLFVVSLVFVFFVQLLPFLSVSLVFTAETPARICTKYVLYYFETSLAFACMSCDSVSVPFSILAASSFYFEIHILAWGDTWQTVNLVHSDVQVGLETYP